MTLQSWNCEGSKLRFVVEYLRILMRCIILPYTGHVDVLKSYNCSPLKNGFVYYMGSSVSRQDDLNPALWLATRADKMALPCPLGTTHRVPEEKFPQSHIVTPLIHWPSLFAQDGFILTSFIFSGVLLDFISVHISVNIQPSYENTNKSARECSMAYFNFKG